jgi:hypothetical protein
MDLDWFWWLFSLFNVNWLVVSRSGELQIHELFEKRDMRNVSVSWCCCSTRRGVCECRKCWSDCIKAKIIKISQCVGFQELVLKWFSAELKPQFHDCSDHMQWLRIWRRVFIVLFESVIWSVGWSVKSSCHVVINEFWEMVLSFWVDCCIKFCLTFRWLLLVCQKKFHQFLARICFENQCLH